MPAVRRLLCLSPLAAAALFPAGAQAADFDFSTLTQQEFRQISEDMGSAFSFKPLIPSEPLGLTGFDLGIAVTGTELKHREVWDKVTSEDVPGTLPVPTLRLTKGLPWNIDIGAFYGEAPSTDVKLYGGELRWAFVPGSTLMPALAVRASYTKLSGVDQLKFNTTGIDVSMSKGFAFATPYVGVGLVKVDSQVSSSGFSSSEDFTQHKVFGGVNLNFTVLNLLFEVDQTGDALSYGAKLGWRF
jgi:hypothetical protein